MASLPPGIIPVPDYLFWSFLAGTILFIISLIGFVIISVFTPAFTFIKAKFRKLPIFLMSGRDGMGGFFTPNKSENQYAIFKKQGVYGIIRNSHIFDQKSKQPIYIADKDIGASLDKDWPRILEQMKLKFKDLKTAKDYKKIVNNSIDNYDDPVKNPFINISGSTIKVSDLAKFFPLNINPTFIQSYGEIRARQERRKIDSMKWMFGMGIFLIMLAIASVLIIGKVNEDKKVCSCDFGKAISEACGSDVEKPGIQKVDNGVIKEIKPVTDNTTSPGGSLS